MRAMSPGWSSARAETPCRRVGALGGPVLAYRRFEVRAVPLDRFASPRVEAALEAVIARRYNTVVFGGTGAGKTTLLDALCARLPPEERLVVVEDTAELILNRKQFQFRKTGLTLPGGH